MTRRNVGLTWMALLVITATLVLGAIAHGATVSWTPVTTYTDGTAIPAEKPITYQVYMGSTATGPWALSADGISGVSATPPDPAPGETRWYTVRAVVDGVPSDYAVPGSKTIPFLTPGPPTGLTVR